MDCDDEHCLGWFPYVHTCGDVVNISAPEVVFKERMVSDLEVNRWVGIVPVTLKLWIG